MTGISTQEARTFLEALFTGGKAIADANPGICPTETTFRPTRKNPQGRSNLLLRKSYTGREERFSLLSSGVSAPKAIEIITLLSEAIGATPTITAVDEVGNPVDAIARPTHIAHLLVQFPGGQSMNWTAVTGIGVHCANKRQFEQLANTFQKPEHSTYAAR